MLKARKFELPVINHNCKICYNVMNCVMLNKYKYKRSWCESSFSLNTPGYNFLFSLSICIRKTNIWTIYGLARSTFVRYGFENATFYVPRRVLKWSSHYVYVTHNEKWLVIIITNSCNLRCKKQKPLRHHSKIIHNLII